MTEQPSWAGDVPSYTAVGGQLPLPQWDEVSQNTLDDLRLRLRESVTEAILMAVRGYFIPGPLGEAFRQLVDWGTTVLNAQNLLDAMNGNYTGDNVVLLAIEAIFGPIRGLVNAIVEPLRIWLTWMWNLFSNVTPNPAPTGPGANLLVPIFTFIDDVWDAFTTATGNLLEDLFGFFNWLWRRFANIPGENPAPTGPGFDLLVPIFSFLDDVWDLFTSTVGNLLENLFEFLNWMWRLFANITPNPEPTGPGANLLVPIFKWLDTLWEGFGDVLENVFAFVLNVFKPLAPDGNPDEFWDGVVSNAKGVNLLPDPRIDTARLWKQAGLAVSTAFSNTAFTSTTTQSLEFTANANGSARSFYWPTNFLGIPYDIGTWPDRIYYVECYVYLPAANPNTTATVKMFGKASIIPFGNGDDIAAMTFTAPGTWALTTLTNPAKGGTGWTKMFGYFKVPTLRNGFTAGITFTAASASYKIYVDDLAIIDVTDAVTTNNKLYGRPTPADTIDAGTKLSGSIADAQVPQITTTWNELYDAFDGTTTPAGTQRTVAQVRARGATVRGSAVAGENKSTTLNTLLYNSQAPTGAILEGAVPGLQASKITSGEFGSAQIAANAITNAKVATDIDAGKLGAGTLPLARITDNTLPGAKLVEGGVAGAKLAGGIDAGTKLTGTLADAQIPVINTAKIPELDPDKVTGLPSLASSTNDSGVVTLRTVESSLIDLTTDVANLKVDREVTSNQGRTIAVSFVQLPNSNDLPTTGTQTWSTQYLTGSGQTFGVTSGKATWKGSGTRTAKVLYRGAGTRQLLSTGTAGTFTLTLGATTTGPLAHNATNAAVLAALGAANVTVSGTNALTGLTITPVANSATVAGVSPISGALSITSSVTGGTATLSDGGETTLTDYQSLRGVLADPPSVLATGFNTAFTALARVSQDGMSYVFARAYWASLTNLRGQIGYCNGGVETIWQTGIELTWSTELTFRLGVDDNPRAYQVFSGSTLVTRYDEGYANFGAFPAGATGRTYVDNTGNRLVVTGTGGSFTLTVDGATTTAIAFNASAATVATALNAALNLKYSGNATTGVVYATVSGTAANTAGTPGGLVITLNSKVKNLTVGNVNVTVNPALITGGTATVANRYTWNSTAFATSTATSGAGAASPLGQTSRRFGAEVRTSGNNNSGTISSVAVSDNPPVVYAGSVARMTRLNTTAVNMATNTNALGTNFFDDVDYESLDIDAQLSDGTFTVTKSKMYMLTGRIRLSTFFTSACYLVLQRWDSATGVWSSVQNGIMTWPYDAFHNVQSTDYAMSGTWLQYLNLGDKVRLATFRDLGSGSVLMGSTDGRETYFSISALQ